MHTHVLILGSGPAGLTAGLYSSLAGFQTTLLTGPQTGGQITLTNLIENYPGAPSISGFDLMDKLNDQALSAGTHIISDSALSVHLSAHKICVHTTAHQKFSSDTLIIATGSIPKRLSADGEDKWFGHGISVCATCDGVFYKNKSVAVLGGGNSAAYEALFLAQTSARVYLIYPILTAEHNLIQRLHQTKNITFLPNSTITSFHGTDKLSSITVLNTKTSETFSLDIDGVFEAIGRQPNSHLFQNQLSLDSDGFIITNPKTQETSISGVFACGDVQESTFRQAIIAAASGATAALYAKKFLLDKGIIPH